MSGKPYGNKLARRGLPKRPAKVQPADPATAPAAPVPKPPEPAPTATAPAPAASLPVPAVTIAPTGPPSHPPPIAVPVRQNDDSEGDVFSPTPPPSVADEDGNSSLDGGSPSRPRLRSALKRSTSEDGAAGSSGLQPSPEPPHRQVSFTDVCYLYDRKGPHEATDRHVNVAAPDDATAGGPVVHIQPPFAPPAPPPKAKPAKTKAKKNRPPSSLPKNRRSFFRPSTADRAKRKRGAGALPPPEPAASADSPTSPDAAGPAAEPELTPAVEGEGTDGSSSEPLIGPAPTALHRRGTSPPASLGRGTLCDELGRPIWPRGGLKLHAATDDEQPADDARASHLSSASGVAACSTGSPTDLFFDLVFLAVAFQLANLLAETLGGAADLLLVLLVFAMYWTTWLHTTLLLSRFRLQSVWWTVTLFVVLAATLVTSTFAVRETRTRILSGLDSHLTGIAVSVCASRLPLLVVHSALFYKLPAARASLGPLLLCVGAAAVLYLMVAGVNSTTVANGLFPLGLLLELSGQLWGILLPARQQLPMLVDGVISRHTLWTVLPLGAGVLGIATAPSSGALDVEVYLACIFGFLILCLAFGFFLLSQPRHESGLDTHAMDLSAGRAGLWSLSVFGLSAALLGVAAGVKLLLEHAVDDLYRFEHALLLSCSLAGALLLINLSRSLHEWAQAEVLGHAHGLAAVRVVQALVAAAIAPCALLVDDGTDGLGNPETQGARPYAFALVLCALLLLLNLLNAYLQPDDRLLSRLERHTAISRGSSGPASTWAKARALFPRLEQTPTMAAVVALAMRPEALRLVGTLRDDKSRFSATSSSPRRAPTRNGNRVAPLPPRRPQPPTILPPPTSAPAEASPPQPTQPLPASAATPAADPESMV